MPSPPNRDALPMRHALPCLLIVLVPATWVVGAKEAPRRGFEFERPEGRARGFAPAEEARSQAGANGGADRRDRDYARGLLTKYDANGDRVLQEDEWRRISGSPEKADTNGDKEITYGELVARVSAKRREKNAASATPRGDARSYRLLTQTEKLPEGLPSWFASRDRDGDGQVAMHEYSRRWTDREARRFRELDPNDDGVITPAEALGGR